MATQWFGDVWMPGASPHLQSKDVTCANLQAHHERGECGSGGCAGAVLIKQRSFVEKLQQR